MVAISTTTKPVIFTGDLSGLTENQKSDKYIDLCQAFNLDPNTYPFKVFRIDGKGVLGCDAAAAQYLLSKYFAMSNADTATGLPYQPPIPCYTYHAWVVPVKTTIR